MDNIEKLNSLYLEAKNAYYNRQPIMSDSEFDELETKLKKFKSDVVNKVGAFDRYAKIEHPSSMKSLEKIQADKESGFPPVQQFQEWINEISKKLKLKSSPLTVEIEPKLDGNAVNLVYKNGVLIHALSRGDGKLGRDYLSKLSVKHVPFLLPMEYSEGIVEIRCEAVIPKDVFEDKYSKSFSNERNYVAGILNSDNYTDEEMSEIDIVPVEIKIHNNGAFLYQSYDLIEKFNFKHTILDNWTNCQFYVQNTKETTDKFVEEYNQYISYKDNFRYRIDGMVVKVKGADSRNIIGEVEHHPKWAIAVKFKPEDCVTEITGFEMSMGKTGNFTPVALLKPVDLDGSIVSKASAYNYDFIKKNSLNVGSLVTLVKSGDIIPQIVNVVSPSDKPYNMPSICPYCGSKLELLNGKHVHCPNDNCVGKKLYKFINSFDSINLYGVGEAFVTDLFYKVNDSSQWYFTTPIETVKKEVISKIGDGKIVLNFINKLSEVKTVSIEKVIAFLSFDGISDSGKTVKEIAKKLSGLDYSFIGLEKKVVEGWNDGESKYNILNDFISNLNNNNIEVEYLSKPSTETKTINICMTGSPKTFGYKTKSEYLNKLSQLGYNIVETTVNDCEYLITDDLNSSSSKMKKAQTLNKQIKTYDFLNYG